MNLNMLNQLEMFMSIKRIFNSFMLCSKIEYCPYRVYSFYSFIVFRTDHFGRNHQYQRTKNYFENKTLLRLCN